MLDYEVRVTAIKDMRLSGQISLQGSAKLKAGRDMDVLNTSITATNPGERLLLQAGGYMNLGNVLPQAGDTNPYGVLLAADALLDVRAGGVLTLAGDSNLYTHGVNSTLRLQADGLQMGGSAQAGFDALGALKGAGALLDVRVERSLYMGGQRVDVATGNLVTANAALRATGNLTIGTGQASNGFAAPTASCTSTAPATSPSMA
jgi:hypothetical protein